MLPIKDRIMKFLSLLMLLILITSCNEITKNDIQGTWIQFSNEYTPRIQEFHFVGDEVEIISDFSLKDSGVYKLEDNTMQILLDRDSIIIKSKIKINEDTLFVFDSLKYVKNEIFSTKVDQYNLVGIPTNRLLSKENKYYFDDIHYYKSKGIPQIRYADKVISKEDIPLCVGVHHRQPDIMIVIGDGISVKDLKEIYYYLVLMRYSRIYLATKREGFDTHIFEDKIEIWWDDLQNHLADFKYPSPPPPEDNRSKVEYLKSGAKEMLIKTRQDFYKLDQLNTQEKYLISIDSNITMDDYLSLKSIIQNNYLSFNIVTEIL